MRERAVKSHRILWWWHVGIYEGSRAEGICLEVGWSRDLDKAFEKAKTKLNRREAKADAEWDRNLALNNKLYNLGLTTHDEQK